MATTRTKDVGVTKTTLAADTYLYGDGNTDGSHKILGSDVANYVASEEGGNTLASLSGGKVPTAQLPWTGETFLGTSTVASLPAPGGLNAGEYYITTDSGTNHSVTFAAGDKAISDGTSYSAISDGVRPIGEGGTGASTEEGARTNLEVDSKDEIAEGLTRNEPSLWNNTGVIIVSHDSALSFADGTVDFPNSGAMWVRADDWTPSDIQILAEKSNANEGWSLHLRTDGKLEFKVRSSATNKLDITTTSALGLTDGEWAHIAWSKDGAGTGFSNTLQNTLDSFVIYVNGQAVGMDAAVADTGSKAGYESDGGSQDPTENLVFFGYTTSSSNFEGEIRNVQLFNSALTAAQVEQVYRSGVPYELSQASAAAIYTSDFTSDSADGFSASGGSAVTTSTVGSDSDNLQLDVDTSTGSHLLNKSSLLTVGKSYLISLDYYVPSGQSNIDGLEVRTGTRAAVTVSSATTDAWTTVTGVAVADTAGFNVVALDGGSTSFTDAGGDDTLAIRNVVIKEAGAILDLNAADATGTNLPDRSGNGFNGTLSSMTVAGNAVNLPAVVSANHPNPSSGEALCSLGNNGTEVFKVDDSGNTVIAGDPVITNSTTPASASATGTAGTVAWDADYIYVCTATNTWKRAAISTW